MPSRRTRVVIGAAVLGLIAAACVGAVAWASAFVPYVPLAFYSGHPSGYHERPEWNTDAHQRAVQEVMPGLGIVGTVRDGAVWIPRWQAKDHELIWNCTTKARDREINVPGSNHPNSEQRGG